MYLYLLLVVGTCSCTRGLDYAFDTFAVSQKLTAGWPGWLAGWRRLPAWLAGCVAFSRASSRARTENAVGTLAEEATGDRVLELNLLYFHV